CATTTVAAYLSAEHLDFW
nr:immunoglobulin heavy chain junction region [Macaca mulatta]MOW98201.1 immunoglobulin heavy chain junction region [Macaca mulatta]MOW98527.1 immunoglobulin heavy chain junction region [Macaca mulatta]MOW98528.1 immunoglobulin heavy chain junction region [Macaca mulatta]MOW98704.1 immunoglobulin heavy chain junction region [Macaca mulatta]